MDLAAVRGALVAGLTAAGWEAYAGFPGSHGWPAAIVAGPIEVLYHRTYSSESSPGRRQIQLDVDLRVSRPRELDAQRQLDDAVSTLPDVLEAIVTDAWLPRGLRVDRAGPYRPVQNGETKGLAVSLTLLITTRKEPPS